LTPRIALDAMSGDHGPHIIVPAALKVLSQNDDLQLIFVGDEAVLKQELGHQPAKVIQRISITHATQRVEMDDPPSRALRNKRDSSMRIAINLVKEGKADACVSAGNTGALMATARYVLKTLPGIDRPAIITALPNMHGTCTHVLDLGANIDTTPEHLFQFAVMGSVLSQAVDNLPSPRIGLLNIGQEEIKGNERVKEAAKLIAMGNVALKTTEGVAKMISHYVKQSFTQNWLTRLAAIVSLPIINNLRKKIDPRRYNGASLLGLRGIVIKSHGSADVLSFSHAIKEALIEVQKNEPSQIKQQLGILLSERRRIE